MVGAGGPCQGKGSEKAVPHRPHHGPAPDEPRDDESQAPPDAGNYLAGERIVPRRIEPGISVADLLDRSFPAYNARRIHQAARLLPQRMLPPAHDCAIVPTA